jgi:uncharacterized Fe-S cluster-containing radical SAM superfamily protein
MDKITQFLEVAKELNYDVVALYAKEPQAMQIIAAALFVVLILVFLMIKKSMNNASANKALQNLEGYLESFEEYQENLRKILKVMKGAKGELLETLTAKKEEYYKEQLRTLRELPLDEKIQKYQEMAKLYAELAKAAKNEELSEFYAQKAEEILEEVLLEDITAYMREFSFTPEDVSVLEAIVAYADTKEDSEALYTILMEKLKSVDFGSNLERYTFVQNLDEAKLGEIYRYCKEQQDKLFEDGEKVVAAEVLEYLLENGELAKVTAYIKSLKVPTHLQELYRFFNQKGIEELDFAFIANPIAIQQAYSDYLESLVTDGWRDANRLEALLEKEKFADTIGHDRVRIVIERIDALRATQEESEKLEEALTLAKEAHAMALETKSLLDAKKESEEDSKAQEESSSSAQTEEPSQK